MDKLFLIDAYAIIYRSYYAFIKNPRINSKGLNTSAIMGFMNTLSEVLTRYQPTYLGIAFDHGKTFRHELYPAYKAQREAQPEDIARSVPILREIFAAMHIPCLQAEGFEADDVIGTLAHEAGSQGIETYMLTLDKDFAQIVGQNIFLFRPRHNGGYDTLDTHAVCEKYDISSTQQIIDLLALMGDASDNFAGCPGIGPKTATQLIKQFGSVDSLLAHTEELQGKLREKIESNIDSIRLAQTLATIRTDVPIALDLEALRVKPADDEALSALFASLEFRAIRDKFIKSPMKTPKNATKDDSQQLSLFAAPEQPTAAATTAKKEKKTTPAAAPADLFATIEQPAQLAEEQHDYRLVSSADEMQAIVSEMTKESAIAFFLLTTAQTPIDARPLGIALAAHGGEAFYFPLDKQQEKASEQLRLFQPLLESSTITKICHDIKPAIEVLRHYGTTLAEPLFDTMVAHYLLQPELRHSFEYVAETMMGCDISPLPKTTDNTLGLEPSNILFDACQRADIALQLCDNLKPRLTAAQADNLFYDIEMPLVSVLADMEYHGVRLDTQALHETSRALTERMQQTEQEIYRLAGHTFNISSPRQVGDVLFGEMKVVDRPKKTRTGQYVTNEEELQKIAPHHDIARRILDYRALRKLISTYIDALPQLVNSRTGHIHTSFNQTVTATGRLSSSDPNLQNIPIRGEDGKEIRRCFIPEEGCLFFSADYSQIELRVMAHLSNDDNMLQAFREGRDIHASTAARVYKKTIENVSREERTKAKRANFGIIYGITTWGLAERLLIDRQEAKELIDSYFDTFPQVREYMEQAKETARATGYAETLFHRRRYLPDISSANATVRGFSERNAINAPIQGTAADIIKIAMVKIFRRFEREGIRSKMLLQVHDELNFSVVPEEKEQVERIVITEMENACSLRVPLVADSGWGSNWLEAH